MFTFTLLPLNMRSVSLTVCLKMSIILFKNIKLATKGLFGFDSLNFIVGSVVEWHRAMLRQQTSSTQSRFKNHSRHYVVSLGKTLN